MQTTATGRFIAVTPMHIVEAGNMPIIWDIGATPELAIDDAHANTVIQAEYETLPASDRLADYIERYGADYDLDWTDSNSDGVADLLDGSY